MAYLGNSPGVATQRYVTNAIAFGGQTFIATGNVFATGYVDVIINGTDMVSGVDFIEFDDHTIRMLSPLNGGEYIKIVSWVPRGLSDGYLKSETDALLNNITSFKNKIVNGDMKISQRGTLFNNPPDNAYTLDRFQYKKNNSSVVTIEQSSNVPEGSDMRSSLRLEVTTPDIDIAVDDFGAIVQKIEGYNITDLFNSFTISFWVMSSKTGVHSISIRNFDHSLSYVTPYYINLANTWEKKSITISNGLPYNPFAVGQWNTDNDTGLELGWGLAVGTLYQSSTINEWTYQDVIGTTSQVNCLDTIGNVFAITGIQLEKGIKASDFENRPIAVELALCQRYYETGICRYQGYGPAGANLLNTAYFKVNKRAIPTLTNTFVGTNSTGYFQQQPSVYGFEFGPNITATGTANCSGSWTASAEL